MLMEVYSDGPFIPIIPPSPTDQAALEKAVQAVLNSDRLNLSSGEREEIAFVPRILPGLPQVDLEEFRRKAGSNYPLVWESCEWEVSNHRQGEGRRRCASLEGEEPMMACGRVSSFLFSCFPLAHVHDF